MAIELTLPDIEEMAPVVLHPESLSDDQFLELCFQLETFRVESNAQGEIEIMPPAGFYTSYRNNRICNELCNWTIRDGRGISTDSSGGVRLPNGARRAPDAAWISNQQLKGLPFEQLEKFPPLCPEFVIELRSPSDRLPPLQRKMQEWLDNGALLAWLIDPANRTVYIYRPGQEVEKLVDAQRIAGEGPVAGFELDLTPVWPG